MLYNEIWRILHLDFYTMSFLCYNISTCIAYCGYNFKLNTAKRLMPYR